MTDQKSELDRQIQPDKPSAKKPRRVSGQPGANTDAIAAGLEFLFSIRQQAYWSLCSPENESAAWGTAYVLARLAEIPSHHITFSLRRKIEESMDWLLESRTREGGWGFEGGASADDADSTSWAVTALRQHGRSVPNEALELIQRCRRSDGGFAFYPDARNHGEIARLSSPDVTAIAVRALASIDAASSEFLAAHLRTDVQGKPCRLASIFFVSSTLLDWEPGMAPWFVVNAVRELTCQQTGESAWEKALLLRCMMRLRMQSAWALAINLRRLQQPDGSWPGSAQLARFAPVSGLQPAPHFDEQGILATVTAVSALAMSDLQPGLYFGSDLPYRRL
ncbi:MAG TPA: prenyltransferase/squalene oxidase repeat-containing protein [Candidatus Angelobacter sp.]